MKTIAPFAVRHPRLNWWLEEVVVPIVGCLLVGAVLGWTLSHLGEALKSTWVTPPDEM